VIVGSALADIEPFDCMLGDERCSALGTSTYYQRAASESRLVRRTWIVLLRSAGHRRHWYWVFAFPIDTLQKSSIVS
jgi:hypothetical protein